MAPKTEAELALQRKYEELRKKKVPSMACACGFAAHRGALHNKHP
jgi:hypothetical protein